VHALTTGVLSLIVTAGAIAASDKSTVSFRDIDADGDGRISVTEAGANRRLIREFTTVDTNRDDYVSEREFAAWISAQADIDNPHETASRESRNVSEPWNAIERPQAAIEPRALRRW
jgi:Ca2+-binding EF-hand superfamily protein